MLAPWRLRGRSHGLAVAALLLLRFALVPALTYPLGVGPLLAGAAS